MGSEAKTKILEYKSGDKRETWLARYGIGIGNVRPEKVPYYLLVIGSPEKIPFSFRHQLGVEYGVGSLHFESAAEYSRYVQSVTDYEKLQTIPTAKEAVFFASRHPFDQATQMSADRLVKPLIEGGGDDPAVVQRRGFQTREILAADATKAALTLSRLAPGRTETSIVSFHRHAWNGVPRTTSRSEEISGRAALSGLAGLRRGLSGTLFFGS